MLGEGYGNVLTQNRITYENRVRLVVQAEQAIAGVDYSVAKKGEMEIRGEFQLGVFGVGVGEGLEAEIDQAELAAVWAGRSDQEGDWGFGEVETGKGRVW